MIITATLAVLAKGFTVLTTVWLFLKRVFIGSLFVRLALLSTLALSIAYVVRRVMLTCKGLLDDAFSRAMEIGTMPYQVSETGVNWPAVASNVYYTINGEVLFTAITINVSIFAVIIIYRFIKSWIPTVSGS